jgi:hypothetical protein
MKQASTIPGIFPGKWCRWLIVAVFSLSSLSANPAVPGAQSGPPTLEIDAPGQVELGALIKISLRVTQAADIAGYEAAVLYDTSAAEFAGVQQRQNDLKKIGRDVSPLTAVDLPAGVSVGLYSCPVDDCVTGQGVRKSQGAQGPVNLATVVLVANQPGLLEIKLDATKFVDAAGNPVSVDISRAMVTVEVGAPGDGPTYAAPASMWSLQPDGQSGATPAFGPFDLTGDGQVTNADAMEVAIEWETLRLNQVACGVLPNPTRDVNHDGCLDVADLQLVASHYGPVAVESLPLWTYLPLVLGGAETNPAIALAPALQTWTVNSTNTESDSNIGNGVCRTSAAVCTLQAAIQESNAHTGPDTIVFNIPGSGVQTIQLTQKLPTLNDATGGTTIDGYTQPGAAPNTDALVDNAVINVQIKGNGGSNFDGFVITSAGNTIRGLALYDLKRPFWLYGSGATNNHITGSFVGTNAAGTFGTAELALTAHGFHIEQGAASNYVGGAAVSERNVISGNGRHGLGIWHEQSDGNVVMNNLIGLTPSGDNKLPNRKHGVDLNFGASYNVLGGTGPGERNVISGNDDNGVEVSHTTGTTNNRIAGNYIGTNVSGTRSLAHTPNLGRGILIEDGATENTISDNVVGTNVRGGIEIYDTHTFGNQISNNRIGISVDGTPIPSDFGIWVKGSGLRIGPNNIIAYSTYMGIKIDDDTADFNTVTQNSIFGNGTLGIDIWPRGVNQNDAYPHDGPNERLNFPVLNTASSTLVTGVTCGGCTVEIFVADSGAGGYGEGKTFVGSTTAFGDGTFTASINGAAPGQYLTATATDSAGNTSEFSLNLLVSVGQGPTPTNTPIGTPTASATHTPTGTLTSTPTNTPTNTPNPGPSSTPTAGGTTYVLDTFSRSVVDGWGSPDTGGTYTLLTAPNATFDFDVNGAVGTVSLGSAGLGREAILQNTSVLSIDITFQVTNDKPSVGDSQDILFIGRRINSNTMYRGRIRLYASGAVGVQANKGVAGTWTALGPLAKLPGLTYVPGAYLQVRAQIVGTNPTTIRMKVWPQGQTEPVGWQYSVTDAEPALQAPGGVGFRMLLSLAASNTPVLYMVDNYRVASASLP